MILSLMVSLLVVLKWNDTSKMVLPILRTIEGGGASGAGGALPPSVTGRGKAVPSLLVPSGCKPPTVADPYKYIPNI